MPRPKKPRFVSDYPSIDSFVPREGPYSGEIYLSLEGLEAIRMSDFEGLDQATAAEKMAVSRQTYGRVLAEARNTIAEAIVTGKALKIEGGTYTLQQRRRRHRRCGRGGDGCKST